MEQNEQVICTISKCKIQITNQDLITQKEKQKFAPANYKHIKQFFAEEDKRKKS